MRLKGLSDFGVVVWMVHTSLLPSCGGVRVRGGRSFHFVYWDGGGRREGGGYAIDIGILLGVGVLDNICFRCKQIVHLASLHAKVFEEYSKNCSFDRSFFFYKFV